MKRKLLCSLIVLCSLLANAQTPGYFNSETYLNSNNFPMNSNISNKAQWIFGPQQFTSLGDGNGTAAFLGNITKVFVRLGNLVSPSALYTNFSISLAQNVGTKDSFGTLSGGSFPFTTGMTQCFYQASNFALTGAIANSWYGIPLTTPFFYNPSLSLVVEIKVSGGVGNRFVARASTKNQRMYGGYSSSTGTNVNEAGNFGFNMVAVTVPVLIAKFEGYKENSSDKLLWTSSNEFNNAYFNVQHSTDGIHFSTIAKINSKAINGNSTTDLTYETFNTNPSLGHNYYRLQQVDIDGLSSDETKIVDIFRSTDQSIKVYPNPANAEFYVEMTSSKNSTVWIKINDLNGRILKQVKTITHEGFNKIPVSLNELKSGLYQVQIIENDQTVLNENIRKE